MTAAGLVAATALVVAVTGCDGQRRADPRAAPPAQWEYAALTSPLDAWGSEPTGQVLLFDETGAQVWSQSYDGLQNGQAVAADDGVLMLATLDGDLMVTPGEPVSTRTRASTAGADVVAHGMVVNHHGTGLSFLNEGFADSPRGYSFMLSVFKDSAFVADATLDGYVNSVWSCPEEGWAGAVQSMTTDSLTEGPRVDLGTFNDTAEFIANGHHMFPKGAEISPVLRVPCVDGSGLVLTATTDMSSEAERPPVTDLSLWHLTSTGAARHQLEGWSDTEVGTWLATDAIVIEDTYYWVTAAGKVYSAPVDGGAVSVVGVVDLPSPLPASTVLDMTDDTLRVSVGDDDGIHIREYGLADGWAEHEPVILRTTIPDDQYVSSVVRRGDS